MIALYPGAFKPPHRGHFEVVKSLLDGTYKGEVYSIEDYKEKGIKALSSEKAPNTQISKVVVIIGGGVRNGITPEESKQVWEIYTKFLPGTVEVFIAPNPMIAAKDYAKANPDQDFLAVTGIRSEEDVTDLRRVSTFKNRDNVKGLALGSTGDPSKVRATDFRRAILSGNLDTITDFFPKELPRQSILNIINMLKQSIIAEAMKDELGGLFDNWFTQDTLEEGSSGTAIAPKSATRSEDRAKLVTLYSKLRDMLGDSSYDIIFNQDTILIKVKNEDERGSFDYTPFMGSILEYMIDEGMKITPLPEIKIKRDIVEASDFFGKTAYYNPTEKEVVIYVQGRHPKDVMRSFTHEMIHHMQNMEGRLGNITTTNTNEDSALLEIEQEAYLKGNMTFRNWEDKTKNQ